MMLELLIPYGMDSVGKMVHVNDVPSGKSCGLYCPSCGGPLVAKKGSIRQHHLAHELSHHPCEGWLHSTAKHILQQRIADAIDFGIPVPIQWRCHPPSETKHYYLPRPRSSDTECQLIHTKDLLGKRVIDSVEAEKYLLDWRIRPDIVCWQGNTAATLIEIVVTHSPEPPVIAAGLPVLEVHVSGGTSLEVLAKGAVPVAVMHHYPCPDPICSICFSTKTKGCYRCVDCGKHRGGHPARPHPYDKTNQIVCLQCYELRQRRR